MTEAKPLASLSPSLLARKGAARPAMRPQLGAVAPDALARQIQDMSWSDDLGWNDMGEDHDPVAPDAVHHQLHGAEPAALPVAQVVPITPEAAVPAAAEVPEVVRQQAEVAAIVREKVRPQPQTQPQPQAKAKPLATKTPADYGVDVAPRLTVVKTVEPAGRKAGVKVGSVDELIAKLKDEAGVI